MGAGDRSPVDRFAQACVASARCAEHRVVGEAMKDLERHEKKFEEAPDLRAVHVSADVLEEGGRFPPGARHNFRCHRCRCVLFDVWTTDRDNVPIRCVACDATASVMRVVSNKTRNFEFRPGTAAEIEEWKWRRLGGSVG